LAAPLTIVIRSVLVVRDVPLAGTYDVRTVEAWIGCIAVDVAIS
jgi:hypothetical protein